ncbi:MAG: WbqC family protein [Magnetospiraceae bacterium]
MDSIPKDARKMKSDRPGKRVAIVQSSYIPWKGYFDLIHGVDTFILYDEVQFTRRDWRNRNRIKTAQGPRWLTIPVACKGQYHATIDAMKISEPWAETHWNTLRHAYGRAPFFKTYETALQTLYETATGEDSLSAVNLMFLRGLCPLLGITTPFVGSREIASLGRKTEKLIQLCQGIGADAYLSGPAAKAYLRPDLFAAAGIALEFADYTGYPEYPQSHPPFRHDVSIIDLLMHCGPESPRYLKTFGPDADGFYA